MTVGEIVTIRGCAYKIVGFREDGEPRLVRVEASVVRLPGGGLWGVQ